jgi:hypothetical protein
MDLALMNTLRRFLDSPFTELAVGLVLLAAGLLELRDILLVKIPGKGPLLPHAAAAIGTALVLRSLPGMFLGLEIADKAFQAIALRPALAFLDRLAHCHAMDLCMGVILIVAGAADLIDTIASGRNLPALNITYGAIVFGLAPFLNTFLALYKGVMRIDREYPVRLMDRAVQNPWVQFSAGLLMLGGGLAELWTTLQGDHAFGHRLTLSGGFAVIGLFALLSGLPGIYLGLRTLLDASRSGR